ncbi:hypothetical protein Ciccas_004933 [Cichlidogyrus casuarinus]|uniref:Uncharacterized protein n=1 Tax=Cichlidogyrus casuarinus TaxID=1844966 RepID=A0ABD2QDL3_9PLAT
MIHIAENTMCHGPNWEPAWGWLNSRMECIFRPSQDPSRPVIGWWDRIRLTWHGRIYFVHQQMTWLYSISPDPQNTEEYFAWHWTKCFVKWQTGLFIIQGDFEAQSRSSVKHEGICRLLFLPDLELKIALDWLTLGDPHDHHSVRPVNPNRVNLDPNQPPHDTYHLFRAHRVNMDLSFTVKSLDSRTENRFPRCFFYTNVIKFLDKMKMCFARVSRPIRRGLVFKRVKPRRPNFSRLFESIHLTVSVPELEITYWVSQAKRIGVFIHTGPLQLAADFNLVVDGDRPIKREFISLLHPTSPETVMTHQNGPHIVDGLIRRPRAIWSIKQLILNLHQLSAWLRKRDCQSGISVILKSMDLHKNEGTLCEGPESTSVGEKFVHGTEFDCSEAWAEIAYNTEFVIVSILRITKLGDSEREAMHPSKEGTYVRVGMPDDQAQTDGNANWYSPELQHQSSSPGRGKASLTHEDLTPANRVEIHSFKMRWNKRNRDLVFEMMDSWRNARELKRNLSAQALKHLQVHRRQRISPQSLHANAIRTNRSSSGLVHPPRASPIPSAVGNDLPDASTKTLGIPLLGQLLKEAQSTRFIAHCEENWMFNERIRNRRPPKRDPLLIRKIYHPDAAEVL